MPGNENTVGNGRSEAEPQSQLPPEFVRRVATLLASPNFGEKVAMIRDTNATLSPEETRRYPEIQNHRQYKKK